MEFYRKVFLRALFFLTEFLQQFLHDLLHSFTADVRYGTIGEPHVLQVEGLIGELQTYGRWDAGTSRKLAERLNL